MIRYIDSEDMFIFRKTEYGHILHEREKQSIINFYMPVVDEIYLSHMEYTHEDGMRVLEKFNKFTSKFKNFHLTLIILVFMEYYDIDKIIKFLTQGEEIDLEIQELLQHYIEDLIILIKIKLKRFIPSNSCNITGEDYEDVIGENLLISCGSYYFLNGVTLTPSQGERSIIDVILTIVHKEEMDEE